MLFYEILYGYLFFCCLFLVKRPCYSWFLNKTIDISTYILNPHPNNPIYLFTIDFYPLFLANSSSHKEIWHTIMTIKLNLYSRVNSVVNIYTSLLLYFSGCTGFRSLMLIPFTFWESILPPNLYYKNFGLLSIEYDSTTNRFILL